MDITIKNGEAFYFPLQNISAIIKKKKVSYVLLKGGHSVCINNENAKKLINDWSKINRSAEHKTKKTESSYVNDYCYPIKQK